MHNYFTWIRDRSISEIEWNGINVSCACHIWVIIFLHKLRKIKNPLKK